MVRVVFVSVVATSWLAHAEPAPDAAPPPPPPEVKITRVTTRDQTSLAATTVRAKIARAYLAGLRRCYEQVLATTPDASGAATVTFTVNAVGKVSAPAVRSFERGLSRCLRARAAAWRFPIPLKYAEPTTARFTVALQLAPAVAP